MLHERFLCTKNADKRKRKSEEEKGRSVFQNLESVGDGDGCRAARKVHWPGSTAKTR